MTLVKVCGLTRDGDVLAAVELGAWACGFVLTESRRRVSPERARELAALARDALTVAVVSMERPVEIAAWLDVAGMDAVQLSAGADGPSVGLVKGAAARRGLWPLIIAAADTPDAEAADYVLLDARLPGVYGGTGRRLDWDGLGDQEGADRERLVLAGGIDPDNVAEAIAKVRPCAVDVSSGIETAPGIKDGRLLARLFAAAGATVTTGGAS